MDRAPGRIYHASVAEIVGGVVRRAGGRHAIDLGDWIVLVGTGLGVGLKLAFFGLGEDHAINNLRGANWNLGSRNFCGWRGATGRGVGACKCGGGSKQEHSTGALNHASTLACRSCVLCRSRLPG